MGIITGIMFLSLFIFVFLFFIKVSTILKEDLFQNRYDKNGIIITWTYFIWSLFVTIMLFIITLLCFLSI